MKIVKAFIALMTFIVIACSDFNNPISSEIGEQNDTNQESGTSEQG